MKVEGSYRFDGPPERVWEVLQDPEALQASIPGCRSLQPVGDQEYAATVAVGIAAFKGTYTGRVRVAEQDAPRYYQLHVEGSGAPGHVRGVGRITLTPDGDGTRVAVDGDAQVGGPVLSVGSRLVVPAARLLMNQFFESMRRRVAGGA